MLRKIELTDAAIQDIRWQRITRGEYVHLLAHLKRVAALPFPVDDYMVTEVHCCDDEWYRLKDKESNIRVFFFYDEVTLTVTCMLRRSENTYKLVEIIWRSTKRVGV